MDGGSIASGGVGLAPSGRFGSREDFVPRRPPKMLLLRLRGGSTFQDLESDASGIPDYKNEFKAEEEDDLLGSQDESFGELVKKEFLELEKQAASTGSGGGAGGKRVEEDHSDEAPEGREDSDVSGLDARERKVESDSEREDVGAAGSNKDRVSLDDIPIASASLMLEQLTLDGSIQKNQMTTRDDTAKPERGQEVFFHFRGFCGDAEFIDSRRRDGHDTAPVKMMLRADKTQGEKMTLTAFNMDRPYMGAWELCLRSLSRGETALFLVKGAQRVAEMLGPDAPCQAPDWVPRDGSVQLRFVVELLNFGFKDVIPGGDISYKCFWDGTGYVSPFPTDEVLITFVAYMANSSDIMVASSKGKRWVQLGVGILPVGVETALTKEYRKGAAGTVILRGEQTKRASLEASARSLEGLKNALEGREEPFDWLRMCGASLGQVRWGAGSAAYDWDVEGRMAELAATEGAEEELCVKFDLELHDWNRVHNMSRPDPRLVGADSHSSCGSVIVKNLVHREDPGESKDVPLRVVSLVSLLNRTLSRCCRAKYVQTICITITDRRCASQALLARTD